MEISGISNSYDYLLKCKVVGCIMWYYCKVIVLVFSKMMGMRAFVWFWVMVSFYGAFSCQIRAQVHLTLLSGFTKTWYLAYYWGREGLCLGACERMFRTGRVCFGWLLGRVAAMCFLEPVRGFCGGLECAEWVKKTWFAVRMSWMGLKVLLSASAGVGWGAVCCSVVAEGHSASHDGGKSSSCR